MRSYKARNQTLIMRAHTRRSTSALSNNWRLLGRTSAPLFVSEQRAVLAESCKTLVYILLILFVEPLQAAPSGPAGGCHTVQSRAEVPSEAMTVVRMLLLRMCICHISLTSMVDSNSTRSALACCSRPNKCRTSASNCCSGSRSRRSSSKTCNVSTLSASKRQRLAVM